MRKILLFLLTLAFCLAAGTGSVWDGVYTTEQSTRGRTVYREECAKCHGENLMGGEAAPALAGKDFLKSWNGRSVAELLEVTTRTMPSDDPGNLSRRQYVDIVAWILNSNEFPAGPKALENTPALKDIGIEDKKK